MVEETIQYMALAQGMVAAIEEDIEITNQQRRIFLNRFIGTLRPVCNATDMAFGAGFDAGAKYAFCERRSE